MHQVTNAAASERIHLVADTVGSDTLAQLVRDGRAPGYGAPAAWRAEPVMMSNVAPSALRFETVNVPQVMTPWELREHLFFLFGETSPHSQLAVGKQIAARFLVVWQALWAEYGADCAGWPAYRAALDDFEQSMERSAVSLQLVNGTLFMHVLRGMILRVALADRRDIGGAGAGSPQRLMAETPARVQASGRADRDPVFDRPMFIISPPRAGSTLLFETLLRAPQVFTIGHESHALIEGMHELHPAQRGFDSNRLDAAAATPAVAAELRKRFQAELRDSSRRSPLSWPVRMLEKTPKNALRVAFLAKVFPEAQFIYLHRDPLQTLSSMLEAWQCGRFRTYPQLPDWQGPPWSLLLVPGWRELSGRPLEEIVATQWEVTTRLLLDDLQGLPPGRCHVAQYAVLVAHPAEEVARLCAALDLEWGQSLPATLPLSRFTVSAPGADKWRRHATTFAPQLSRLRDTMERAAAFATR
jgi:hypothetical protein